VHGQGDAHSGKRLAARIDKMLAAGRITEDEAAQVWAAAESGTIDDVVREIQVRHAREWLAAAVAEGRVSERDAAEALDRLERGDDPDAIRALRRGPDRS
jgi:DNA-binding FrmR family transcriptional regulator